MFLYFTWHTAFLVHKFEKRERSNPVTLYTLSRGRNCYPPHLLIVVAMDTSASSTRNVPAKFRYTPRIHLREVGTRKSNNLTRNEGRPAHVGPHKRHSHFRLKRAGTATHERRISRESNRRAGWCFLASNLRGVLTTVTSEKAEDAVSHEHQIDENSFG